MANIQELFRGISTLRRNRIGDSTAILQQANRFVSGEYRHGLEIHDLGTEILTKHQILNQIIREKLGIYERDGVWKPSPLYPDLPIAIRLDTDNHFGAEEAKYQLLDEHDAIVEETPNMYKVTNGDNTDAFTVVGKWQTGVYTNPLSPQRQTQSYLQRQERLAEMGKLPWMSFGNHNDGIGVTGYDWYESFLGTMAKHKVMIFPWGGKVNIEYGSQTYVFAFAHMYWGNSKVNPTNMIMRFMEHENLDADILFLGHTHQSQMLFFERGGKQRIGVIGGTYKLEDHYARKWGIGGRAGFPGHTVILYPHEHKMIGFKHIEDGQQFLLKEILVHEVEQGKLMNLYTYMQPDKVTEAIYVDERTVIPYEVQRWEDDGGKAT